MSATFLLLVLEILKKYHKGDLAGHCPIYIYAIGNFRVNCPIIYIYMTRIESAACSMRPGKYSTVHLLIGC